MLPPTVLNVATCASGMIVPLGAVSRMSRSCVSVRWCVAEYGFDHVLNIDNVQAIARGLRAVDLDQLLRQFALTVDHRARDAGHIGYGGEHILRVTLQFHQIVAEHLDHDLPVDLRN
jgi:hypothetical protein